MLKSDEHMHISTLNNEKELLMQARNGNESAFTKLFYAYHNKLGSYILRLTESREIAEEIVQDVFMKIWIDRESLATIDRFGPYLYVISRNYTFNYLRRLAKEQMHDLQTYEILKTNEVANDSAETMQDYYILLDQAVETLPQQQRKAYILCKRELLKYDEIAKKMNISKETVKKYLKLAKHSIIEYIHAHEDLLVVIALLSLSLQI